MNERRAVVIVVDGLRAGALGTYGNTWHGTPALDALASESVVVETLWAESLELADFYRAAWADGEWPRSVAAAGGEMTFVTDDAAMAAQADATPGVEAWQTPGLDVDSPAAGVSETAIARLIAASAERLDAWEATPATWPRVLWIHSQGYRGPWDAPLDLRASLLEEGDPDPPTFIWPPSNLACDDHDALLSYRVAYAAQTIVLDDCLGGLLAAAVPAEGEDLLVVLTSPRGFALGEHGVVGGACSHLHGEQLHLPCVIYTSGRAPAPPRRRGLATPTDLGATLLAWLGGGSTGQSPGVDLRDESCPGRTYIASRNAGGERSLRTDDWFLRRSPIVDKAERDTAELYVKPDDRWEANEVADRRPHDVEELLALLSRAEGAADAAAFARKSHPPSQEPAPAGNAR
jgi:hypothetical protein